MGADGKTGDAPDIGYDRYPRGRVSYNMKSSTFRLLADRCILREKNLVATILFQMNLLARDTETSTDKLYRCFRCWGRRRQLVENGCRLVNESGRRKEADMPPLVVKNQQFPALKQPFSRKSSKH